MVVLVIVKIKYYSKVRTNYLIKKKSSHKKVFCTKQTFAMEGKTIALFFIIALFFKNILIK